MAPILSSTVESNSQPSPLSLQLDGDRFLSGGRAEKARVSGITPTDIVVAVMGPSGAGMSSFIKLATGHGLPSVGQTLNPCTKSINVVKLSFPGLITSGIYFVDTPGFDGDEHTEIEIFKMLTDWKHKTFKKEIQLSGLIYFHKISNHRMPDKPFKHATLVESLCGKDLHNVVLVTSFWDDVVPRDVALGRQKELEEVYWKALIAKGSRVQSFEGFEEKRSTVNVLLPFIDALNRREASLLEQDVADLGDNIRLMDVGSRARELEILVAKHQNLLGQIRRQLQLRKVEDADDNQLTELMEQYDSLAAKLRAMVNEIQITPVTVGNQFKHLAMRMLDWIKLLKLVRSHRGDANSRQA